MKTTDAIKKAYSSILHLGFNGYLEVTAASVKDQFTAPSSLGKLKRIVSRFFALPIKSILYQWKFRKHPSAKALTGKNVLFVISTNNRNSLLFLRDMLPDTVVLGTVQHTKEESEVPLLYHFDLFKYCFKYFSIKAALKEQFGAKADEYKDYIFSAAGMYEASLQLLKKARPNSIIFTNDHSPAPRAMLMAARELGILTVYIQHASTTRYFPPLDYDLSLLDGPYTLEKYETYRKAYGEVKYIGMPKFQAFLEHRSTRTTVERIGICCNIADPADSIEQLINALVEAFPNLEIAYRAHPFDTRTLNLPQQVKLSNAKQENPFDFLKRQDIIIAGNTSIHLEAALLNVPSAYYRFGTVRPEVEDYYGFVEKGLIADTPSKQDVITFIRSQVAARDSVYLRCKPFDALVGTKHDGKGAELAGQYLTEFLDL